MFRLLIFVTTIIAITALPVSEVPPVSGVPPDSEVSPFSEVLSESVDLVGEYGDYFEGDMVISPSAIEYLIGNNTASTKNAVTDIGKKWPKNTVIYEFRKGDFDKAKISAINTAMKGIQSVTCIKFVEKKKTDNYAVLIKGNENGCFSNIGYLKGGGNVINYGPSCFINGKLQHELLHTLGFYHMQSTYDRDDYVKIEWDNIKTGREKNFVKYNKNTVTNYGTPYDYGSVMHYSKTAFSKNGNPTIVPLKPNVSIGQREGVSEIDIIKLKKMYC